MDPTASSHCPNCLAEYRTGFDTCADCGVALVPGPAPAPPSETSDADEDPRPAQGTIDPNAHTVVLCRLPSVQAEILAGRLRSEGIAVAVDDQPLHLSYGPMISIVEPPRVWVLESQVERAREIARRALTGEDAI